MTRRCIAHTLSAFPQPGLAYSTAAAWILAAAAAWHLNSPTLSNAQVISYTWLGLTLVGAMVVAYLFPIHVGPNIKVHMNSVVLYLAAVLTPPALAVVIAPIALLAGECAALHRLGNHTSETVTQVARLSVVALATSLAAHIAGHSPVAVLLAGATVMFLGDIATAPLIFSPSFGQPPHRIFLLLLREAGAPEGAEYLVGVLGALIAEHELWTLVLLILPTALVYVAFKHGKEMQDGTRRLVETMADTVDLRDSYTAEHSKRVTVYTDRILTEMRKEGPEARLILAAARVHDIGKIGIPDTILKKDGRLSSDEWVIMQTHATRGAELLGRYPDFVQGAVIVRHHHERWDGQGYPDGLRGRTIPFGSRAIAIADSFDAMTTDRPYRRALSPERAAAILLSGRGTQWDPHLVDVFLRTLDRPLDRTALNLHVIRPDDPAATA